METPKYTRTYGGGGSGRRGVGRPSKGPKPIKVPRRGLGVAQLEKLRLEEEQKNAVANASLTNSPYGMNLQSPNLLHSIQPSSSNSVPSSTVSFANTIGGSEASWHDVPVLGHVSGPQFWAPQAFEFQKNFRVVDPGLAFASSFPYESNSMRAIPNWVQRTQQQNSSSSMVSGYSGTSSSSTSVRYSSVEPPSNQNYSGSYVSKRHEEMMTGFKRPNPFSLDVPTMSSSNSTPLTSAPMRTSETISCRSGRSFNLDFGNSTLREIPFLSASNSELISKKSKKENKSYGGDFLTLAPPTQCSHSKLKFPSTSLSLHHQGNTVDQVPPPSVHNQINQQQQYWYNFIPPAEKVEQIGQQSYMFQNCNAAGESLDLNLKL